MKDRGSITVSMELGEGWLANPSFIRQRGQRPLSSGEISTPHSRQVAIVPGVGSIYPLQKRLPEKVTGQGFYSARTALADRTMINSANDPASHDSISASPENR